MDLDVRGCGGIVCEWGASFPKWIIGQAASACSPNAWTRDWWSWSSYLLCGGGSSEYVPRSRPPAAVGLYCSHALFFDNPVLVMLLQYFNRAYQPETPSICFPNLLIGYIEILANFSRQIRLILDIYRWTKPWSPTRICVHLRTHRLILELWSDNSGFASSQNSEWFLWMEFQKFFSMYIQLITNVDGMPATQVRKFPVRQLKLRREIPFQFLVALRDASQARWIDFRLFHSSPRVGKRTTEKAHRFP